MDRVAIYPQVIHVEAVDEPITLLEDVTMSTITTQDGTQIYYKDWGEGPVVTFSQAWPLNADVWERELRTS